MSKFFLSFLLSVLLSCSHNSVDTTPLEKKSHEELAHFALQMSLIVPALNSAIGTFEEDSLRVYAQNLPGRDFQALVKLSQETFQPVSVYGKIHAKTLLSTSREESFALAKRLKDPLWQTFAAKMGFFYTQEGYSQVAKVMRALDEETYPLNIKRARVAEEISRNSFDYNIVKILFSKTGKSISVEDFLYKKSLFVAVYLATENFTQEQLNMLAEIGDGEAWQKHKKIFEAAIIKQYDLFFEKLKAFVERESAG